jgi:hypothetical protein
MRKKIVIFVAVIMGMFTLMNAGTAELAVTNGTFKNYFTVGISSNFKVSSDFYLELELFYLPRTRAFENNHVEYINGEGVPVIETIIKKDSAVNFNMSALFRLKSISNQKWFYYLTAGAGYLSELQKWQESGLKGDQTFFRSGYEGDHKWDFCFGGGVKYSFNNKVGVRFDGRLISILDYEDGDPVIKSYGPRFTGGFYIKL